MPKIQDLNIKALVNRFLGWSLPKTFGPDCGISFKQPGPNSWPTGTNLFTADEATEMFSHVLALKEASDEPREMAKGADPCPFCGSTDLHISVGFFNQVYCERCDCYGPIGSGGDEIERWNRRTAVASDKEAVKLSLPEPPSLYHYEGYVSSLTSSGSLVEVELGSPSTVNTRFDSKHTFFIDEQKVLGFLPGRTIRVEFHSVPLRNSEDET